MPALTRPSRHIGIRIEAPYARVHAFLADPANWPRWAEGLGSMQHHDDGRWTASQADGAEVTIVFSPPNELGVFDHRVTFADGRCIDVPLRLLRNGDGAELVLTLFRQPEMDDALFDRDADWVRQDLERLKAAVER